jgi:hypothetical protein
VSVRSKLPGFFREPDLAGPEQFKTYSSYIGMVNLIIPPKYLAVYAQCIDDSLPAFQPDEWIEEGRIYQVKHYTEPLNTSEGFAVTILDGNGEEIHPSSSHWSFASDRFEIFSICLN